MGKESRLRAAAPEIMLRREDVPAVAMLSLMDALLVDMERITVSTPYRANIVAGMRSRMVKLSDTFPGKVADRFIALCERYLCGVQDLMDNFFNDMTDEDFAAIAKVQARWPQEVAA